MRSAWWVAHAESDGVLPVKSRRHATRTCYLAKTPSCSAQSTPLVGIQPCRISKLVTRPALRLLGNSSTHSLHLNKKVENEGTSQLVNKRGNPGTVL